MGQWAQREPPFEAAEDLVADYLRRFERAAASMAPGPRHDAVRRLRRLLHDDLLRAEASCADIRSYLKELGTPDELVEKAVAAQGRQGASAPLAVIAIVLITLCWPLGVFPLWYSRYWTRTEKLIATVAVPGGIPAAFYAWPVLMHVALGAVWGQVAGGVLPLASAAIAFYLVVTFVLRVDDQALGTGVGPHF